MNGSVIEQQRHSVERGRILSALQCEYGRGAVSVSTLAGAMDALGYPMTAESLQWSLTYLADQRFIAVTRARDTPGYRADRAHEVHPETVLTARILPLGIQLIDGNIPPDPGVRF